MVAPAEKILAWENQFHTFITQIVTGTDCVSNPFPVLNEGENLVSLKLTGEQLRRIISSLQVGAEWAYPDISQQIVFDFWQAFACPPLLSEQDCIEYPSYSSFIRYLPANPYISPNEIPDGYLTQPFVVNGENGNDIPNYEHYDVLVPFGAITLDGDWFDTLAGQLPTIEIMVNGTGKVGLKMLTSPQGGVAVITLDNPPDILDIIGGVLSGDENIIDLNQDLVSLPPETALELVYELEISTTGIHTIYVVFLPIIDDSLIPVRFGGGFRGLVLCDFIPEGTMGVQSLRFENCNLEQQNQDGSWEVVPGWEDWLSCVPDGGSSGSGSSLSVRTLDVRLPSNTVTTTQTTMQFGAAFTHTPSRSNMLVIVKGVTALHSSATGHTGIQLQWNGVDGIYGAEVAVEGTSGRQISVSDVWDNVVPDVQHSITLRFRAQEAGTATINDATDWAVTIIEWDNAEDLFVQDIRFDNGTRELEKKIGGVWITVDDSLADVLSAIQTIANNAAATANNAAAAAAAAQTTANGAVTVNNTQNTRLASLESDVNSIVNVDIPQINLMLADHETRIDALESGTGDWGGYPTVQPFTSPFSAFDTNVLTRGWMPTGNADIDIVVENGGRLGSCVFIRATAIPLAGYAGNIRIRVNGGQYHDAIATPGSSGNMFCWIPVLPIQGDDITIEYENGSGNQNWRVNTLVMLVVNHNPFTLALLP
jgi:hypothetical protein